MPRGFQPRPGIALVENRHMELSWAKSPYLKRERWSGCIFSIQVGSRTHVLAAPSAKEAKVWVDALTAAWAKCVQHPHRLLVAAPGEDTILGLAGGVLPHDSFLTEYAPNLQQDLHSGAPGRLASLQPETRQGGRACPVGPTRETAVYMIKTITGSCEAASTDARVYVELFGERCPRSSGQQRLCDHKPGLFAAGCTNTFEVRCADVGELEKVVVFHDNSGARPRWFLEALHHHDGMHDAAAQQLALMVQDSESCEAVHSNEQALAAKAWALKAQESSGDSRRSTRIAAVRRDPPHPVHLAQHLRPEDDLREQHGKADIMQRYFDDGYRADY
ncbi:hypothetical protein WJX74_001995 [Apatococcus lobatus]|uniref:PH domain-containing protein n=1 Tax=Apatococcus lobatus TaxID=904363 RepID=A0AAW1SEU1_9CHLO